MVLVGPNALGCLVYYKIWGKVQYKELMKYLLSTLAWGPQCDAQIYKQALQYKRAYEPSEILLFKGSFAYSP